MKSYLLTSALTLFSITAVAGDFTQQQINTANEIKQQALKSDLAFELVESLTTEVGPRMAGTAKDLEAVKWAQAKFEALGFDKVWQEPVSFPAWFRYSESASIVLPSAQPLHITALGNSVSTPAQGLTAQVIVFETLDELIAAPKDIAKGKIVFVNYRMNRDIDGNGYGPAVRARNSGAVEASKKGAVAFMMRSVSTAKHRFAHTGGSHYKQGVTAIPAVALANPDADQLSRLLKLGKSVSVNLNVQAESKGQGLSYNVIGQINGSEKPDEYVLIGGHLDSWDLGTGALDDGAGVAITMAAARLIADAGKTKRSIRVVLFAAEEQGLWGAKAYAKTHKDQLHNIVAAAESDFGADYVYGFESKVNAKSLPVARSIAAQLKDINVEYIAKNKAFGGPDLIPLKAAAAVPIFELHQDGTDYFDYHHTADDTLDKIHPDRLKQNVAAYAVFAYLAAQAETKMQGVKKQ